MKGRNEAGVASSVLRMITNSFKNENRTITGLFSDHN